MYLDFYGFKDEPFRLTPDPRYLHLSEPHQRALTAVLEGVFYRKGLVMLTGPIGTGKTTLVHAALQIIADRKMPIRSALLFNPVLTRDEFLELMLEEFEVHCSSSSKPRRLAALHQMLLDTQKTRGTAVLFIDEAHLLSSELLEEIRLLGNADTHEAKLLQIVLSGQPELLTLMMRSELSALRQRVAARANLRPLTLTETDVYIQQRLAAAGLQGPLPFQAEAVQAIHNFSDGVPRLINLIGDASLAFGFRRSQTAICAKTVDEVASAMGLGVAAVPTAARNVVRVCAPVWQEKLSPVLISDAEGTLFESGEVGGAGQESIGERTPTQAAVLINDAKRREEHVKDYSGQKTAVDRLIDAMKLRATAGRGAR